MLAEFPDWVKQLKGPTSKLGLVEKVGDDDNGGRYYANFQSEGVNVEGIGIEKGTPTGVASIMVGADDGQNIITIVPGANKLVSSDYVRKHEESIKRAKVVLVQLEIPVESTFTAVEIARKNNALVIFNTAPGSKNIPKELFALSDIVCLNETEAELVTNLENIKTPEDAEVAIKVLLEKFSCKTVIITLGPQGVVYWDSETKKMIKMPAPKLQAVDTTGAGDCFGGTLAYCLAKGEKLENAVRQAITNASDSVLRKGTQSSFPSKLL